MFDIHNHIVFGVDDGCRTPEESRELAEAMLSAGHRAVVATPHIRRGLFNNRPEELRDRFRLTCEVLSDLPLELHLGCEYFFDDQLLEHAKDGRLLCLGNSRFVLTELPLREVPVRMEHVLFELRMLGFSTVIAHPERNGFVQKNPRAALELFQRAQVLLQIDLGSLIGHYGGEAQKASGVLLDMGAYAVAACDLHRPADVKEIVAPSLSALAKRLDRRGAMAGVEVLCEVNPRKLLSNVALEEVQVV